MASEDPDEAFLDKVRAERGRLIEQIRQSERSIERSRELLKRLDVLLKGTPKP